MMRKRMQMSYSILLPRKRHTQNKQEKCDHILITIPFNLHVLHFKVYTGKNVSHAKCGSLFQLANKFNFHLQLHRHTSAYRDLVWMLFPDQPNILHPLLCREEVGADIRYRQITIQDALNHRHFTGLDMGLKYQSIL